MGVSTDAILMFGVALEDGDLHIEDADDQDYDAMSKDDPRHMRYMGNATSDGIAIQYHCSDSYTSYIIGYEASKAEASRGYPEVVSTSEVFDPKPLLEYCEKWGLKIDKSVNGGRPGWLLFSWWG